MTVLDLIPRKKKKVSRALPPRVKPVVYAPQLIPSQHPVPTRLRQKLKALGAKFRGVNTGVVLARAVAVAVMLLTLQMFFDWLIDFPFLVRAVILGGDIWLATFFIRRHLLPVAARPPNLEACALMVEKQWPEFRGRIIATVQFAGPSLTAASPELVHALQQETDARTMSVPFGEIVPLRPLVSYGATALILLALWLGAVIALRPGSVALLERIILLPVRVPRKTDVNCLSGNKVIPTGDSVIVEAQARGIIPSHGLLTMKDDSGNIQEITLEPEHDHPDRFSLRIESVEQPFTYVIHLNDGSSETYEVRTVPRPNVISIECEQIYPAYTGLPNVKRTVGNLALLAGSHLRIQAVANSKIEKAVLKLVGIDQTAPLSISGADGKNLAGEFVVPATGLTAFSIQLTNQAGVTSGDETQYRIDLIPDRPPVIEMTYPERLQELYTLRAKPTIAFVASDDFGLAKVSLCYRAVQDDADAADANAPLVAATPDTKRIEMQIPDARPLSMKNQYIWDLAAEKPRLTEGVTIEYWMEAEDANNITGPGHGESEHHTIKIVSEMEKKAEIMERLEETLGTVTELSEKQETLNKGLGDLIQGKKDEK